MLKPLERKKDAFQSSDAVIIIKTFFSKFLLVIVSFMLIGCGAKSTKYYAVKHHQPRQSDLGFSIIPPPGDNWYEKLKNDSLYYLKIEKSAKSYSLQTEAREVRLNKSFSDTDGLLKYVKKEKKEILPKKSYRNEKADFQIENSLSANCVRYKQSYEDHDMAGLRGKNYVVVATNGIFCLHPENRNLGVDVSYIEKSISDVRVKSYGNEGEEFLSSLSFHHPSIN